MADIAVVIPFGGDVRALTAQVEALSGQLTNRAFDVIVAVNRGSVPRDARAEMNQSFHGRGMLHFVAALDRPGPSHARNVGWRFTSASLILFCDDDDVVSPGWVEGMVDGLTRFDGVGGKLDLLLLNGNLGKSWAPASHGELPTKFRHLPFAPSANLGFRRGALVAVDGFDESVKYAEDIDLCWRVQYAGFTFGGADGAIVHYRLRQGLREIWRRSLNYGASDAWLLCRHRRFGASRPIADTLVDLVAVGKAFIDLPRRRSTREKCVARAGLLAGRIVGSARLRLWAV